MRTRNIVQTGLLLYSLLLLSISRNALGSSSSAEELNTGWRLMAADKVDADGSRISAPNFDASHWYTIRRMPATVLQALEDNGVYKDLYFGMNLATAVPHDFWKHDWWYRTAFTVPPGHHYYSVIFNGINYRADVWLNGQLIANRSQIIAFLIRAEALNHAGGDEILPITYDDNYVTLFPHEPTTIEATIPTSQMVGLKPAVRIEGYNVPAKTRQEISH